jgi:integrase
MATKTMRLAGVESKALPKKFGFTVASLDRATCPAGKGRTWLYDARTAGLAMMVTENGVKSFYYAHRFEGRYQRKFLGAYPGVTIEQARDLAARDAAKIADDIDPMLARRTTRAAETLDDLFIRYTDDHAKLHSTEKTRITDKSRFNTCFGDWKTRKLTSIKPEHVQAKHNQIARQRGKVTANRAIQLLRRLFTFAKITPNPAANGEVNFFAEQHRERFLQKDEKDRFLAAVAAEPNETIRDYVYLSLLTGARRANVQAMAWKDISFERLEWLVPGEQSKSGEPMKIHLTPPAIEILNRRKGNESDYVFPARRRGKVGHLVEPQYGWKRILEAAKIEDLRLHDLRRTLGSWMGEAGASLQIIGKHLGHHDEKTTQIYSRLTIDPTRKFVDLAAAALMAPAAKKDGAK